jgi:hypothetical protein
MQTPKHVNSFLSGLPGNLHQIADHCSQLQRLTRLVREFLPSPLNQHCQVANIRDQHLVLHADSPAWSTMLHFQAPALLEYLKQQPGLEHISNIRTKTSQQVQRKSDVKPSHPNSPGTSAALIENLADSMSDSALKKALQRLARHSAGTSRK